MRRMYSENQLKKLISEYSGDIIKVSNIKNLNDKQCDSLECGDMVAKKTGKQYHLYLVTYKQAKHGLCLSYFDASVIETQSYDYTEGHWVYNSEDKTSFADIGGLPDVTGADNGKVLEVLAGAWGIGNKKANVLDAPTDPQGILTEAEFEMMKGGVHINGTFLGLVNPIIFPLGIYGTIWLGTCQAGSVVRAIKIDGETRKAELVHSSNLSFEMNAYTRNVNLNCNNLDVKGIRIIPEMLSMLNLSIPADASSKIYVPKLVNGAWTLVEEV